MSFFIPKKKQVIDEKEQERRNKKYYDFGARISLKLGLPQKVKKANDYYAKHPKSMSFAIMGVCIAMFILNMFASHHLDQQERKFDSMTDYVSATPLISVIDKEMEGNRKVNDLALTRQKIKFVIDSLEKSDNLSPKDSVILRKAKDILNKIGGN